MLYSNLRYDFITVISIKPLFILSIIQSYKISILLKKEKELY